MMEQENLELTGKTREDAWGLLTEWVESESLRRHCLSVETAMRAYARHYGQPEDAWGMLGLLHDFDYERHPARDEHTIVGADILASEGYPQWMSDALLAHGFDERFPRTTLMDKALFAVDELTGFIAAVALVRPSKAVEDVTYSSVNKKMKDRRFAEAVSREEMLAGAEELGVPFDQHVTFVIAAMAANAEALGLADVSLTNG
ncbi:MAG TPA: HDIG domain-containing protein [Thermomicrobiales bacterium]|nr:HDIG domain-containing protein [Thermomicrobiales bacterium]